MARFRAFCAIPALPPFPPRLSIAVYGIGLFSAPKRQAGRQAVGVIRSPRSREGLNGYKKMRQSQKRLDELQLIC